MIAAAKGVDARDEREHDDREWSFRIAMLPDSLYRTPMRRARAWRADLLRHHRKPRLLERLQDSAHLVVKLLMLAIALRLPAFELGILAPGRLLAMGPLGAGQPLDQLLFFHASSLGT